MGLEARSDEEEVRGKNSGKSSGRSTSAKREKKSNKKKTSELISKLTRAEIDELIVSNRDHGKRLAWSFLTSWRVKLPQDEVVSIVGAALCEAANRFDPDKGVAFRTFFFYHIRGMLLKEISRVIQDQKTFFVTPASIGGDSDGTDLFVLAHWGSPRMDQNNPERIIERRQRASACWEACSQLDSLEQEVLVRSFVQDEPLVQIAKDLGYCRCHISRVKSRALSKLKDMLRGLRSESGDYSNERELKIPSAKAQTRTKRSRVEKSKDYTGGRGRRRDSDVSDQSRMLMQLLEAAY